MPYSYFFPSPAHWLSELEKDEKSWLSNELCVIQDQFFYVKGNIELPVRESGGMFVWTVWVSLSRDDFTRARELWENPLRAQEPPSFGWLSTQIPVYPETMNLKTNVHWREVGIRPFVEVEPTDHPLAAEQREGITQARVREIAEFMLHHQS